MQKFKIGIIGNGFVGNALYEGMKSVSEVVVYDKDHLKTIHSLQQVLTSEFIFLCVPTPSNKHGDIDLSYIYEAFQAIEDNRAQLHKGVKIVIKSTVTPGTCNELSVKYQLPVISNPEFLTERFAVQDFNDPRCIVIGGNAEHANQLRLLYELKFPSKKYPYVITDSTTSELIKYVTNCFFSVKISFMNEIKQICDASGANWSDLISGFVADGRVHPQHLDVPGHDGLLGFGGKCLPKDINALTNFAKLKGLNPIMLNAALVKNKQLRQ
jgi:UDPglucose 6-dehydrogenase